MVSLVHKDDRRAYQHGRLDGDGIWLANPRQHEGYSPYGAEAAKRTQRKGRRSRWSVLKISLVQGIYSRCAGEFSEGPDRNYTRRRFH